jgi:hypothetical protein
MSPHAGIGQTAPGEHSPDADRRPDLMAQLSADRGYGVGQDARDFWRVTE